MSITATDDAGMQYSHVPMPANGLCSFSCIAYCLSGDRYAYTDVIEDSFCVFDENINLFIEETEFGQKQNKTGSNLSIYRDYTDFIKNAVANVSRQSLPSMFWLEDAHLIAFSKLYDIAVFVYNSPWNRWVVYNDAGSRGCICLYFNGSHFDVLQGIGSGSVRSPIPKRVVPIHQDTHVSLNNIRPCKTYPFLGVWNLCLDDTASLHSQLLCRNVCLMLTL